MRCFVAIELPEPIRERLASLQERLGGLGKAVRWTRPEQIHLTVKFLGNVAEERVAELCKLAGAVAALQEPFELQIGGVGCFPDHGPVRIVWAGLMGPPPTLISCQQACEQAFAEAGFPPENRPYRPHLTIGRTRDFRASAGIRSAVRQQEGFNTGMFDVDELVFFQSIQESRATTHVPLYRARLGG
jgi:RNA 2',3'-cyclic 3'-phosphodiesterase